MNHTHFKRIDLTGQKFGRLLVLEYDHTGKNDVAFWLCKCDCGNEKIISRGNLKNGTTVSCGCYHHNKITSHDGCKTRLYSIWTAMKKRCFVTTHQAYKNYGGRGIIVCDEWKNDFVTFRDWALGNGYHEVLTIDRINNNGNYEPSNCRWATIKEQMRNRSKTAYVTIDNITRSISEWSEITGISYGNIFYRFKAGYSGEDLLKPAGGLNKC